MYHLTVYQRSSRLSQGPPRKPSEPSLWGLRAGYPGELFLNALQELVLPLIALALLNGVLSLRHSSAGCACHAARRAARCCRLRAC
jgi:hypothetical protein